VYTILRKQNEEDPLNCGKAELPCAADYYKDHGQEQHRVNKPVPKAEIKKM
jgi:hypothetical protein